jgi:hypothetical protein
MKTRMIYRFSGIENAFNPFNKILLVCLLLLGSFSAGAQSVTELTGFLTGQKSSDDPAVVSAAEHLETLLNESKPTVFVSAEITTMDETPPVRAHVKATAVGKLSLENPLFNEVELITIRLKKSTDMNFVLDLLRVTGFPLLKYVYFLCEFPASPDDLNKLFIAKPGITVLYKISLAS